MKNTLLVKSTIKKPTLLAVVLVVLFVSFLVVPINSGGFVMAQTSSDSPVIEPPDSTAAPMQGLSPTWSTQIVATGGSFGTICMVLDSNNNPHMVYNGANGMMYYTFWEGANWKTQNVIQAGEPIALVLDSENRPNVLYKGADGAVYDASWAGSGWSFRTVPEGYGYSLALDSVGNPHLAYAVQLLVSDYPSGITDNICMLNYASWNGSNWSVQTVDKPISNSDKISLALDSKDNPHIMYGYDTYYPPSGGFTATVKFVVWTGYSWEFQTGLSDLDYYGNLVLDSNGYPHFVYRIGYPHESGRNSTLAWASWTGSSWTRKTIVTNSAFGFSTVTAFALDSNDYPHVEFFNGSLMYASWTGNQWGIQTVAPDRFAYSGGPLALDSNGSPSICYWVNDIHNTTAFVSALIYTTPTPVLIPSPTPSPTPTTPPTASASISELWSCKSNWNIVGSPVLANGFAYFTSGGTGTLGLYCLNALTGAEVWSHNGLFSTFSVVNKRVYVGGADFGSSNSLMGVISCLDASTGAQVWNYTAGTGFGTPVVGNGMVYAGGYGYTLSSGNNVGFICAFNGSTGETLWNSTGPSSSRFGGDSIALEGTNLYALSAAYSSQDGSWQSGVYAFNAYTGEELWNYTSAGQFGSFIVAGQNLYVTSDFVDTRNYADAEQSGGYIYEGGVLALNASNGKRIWDCPTSSSVGTPTVMNGTLYVVSGEGTVYAFDAADGRVVWSYTAGTGMGSLQPVNDYLYVGSSSGVYCFNAQNGAVIWNFATNDFAGSSPTFPTYADGVIYVGWNGPQFFSPATQHNFYALEASNGKKLWNYTLDYTIKAPPVIEDGTVYVSGSFVTTESPDHESTGAVFALKPSISSLPLPTLSPPPSPTIPELPPWIILPLIVGFFSVLAIFRKRWKQSRQIVFCEFAFALVYPTFFVPRNFCTNTFLSEPVCFSLVA
ncbi:MAG: PQQ-binding-like beta-propeller repeat protein [Candidatus Bathyarchaeota archaeon]|nr:PQQ-binding-like beta-propeller repeat protein [Candidatus Bathyarchaeota archaeon]